MEEHDVPEDHEALLNRLKRLREELVAQPVPDEAEPASGPQVYTRDELPGEAAKRLAQRQARRRGLSGK